MSRAVVPRPSGLPGAASALPADVKLALFVGGLPSYAAASGKKGALSETLGRLFNLAGRDEEALESMLGPLARAGFDPMRPGKVGLAAAEGLALFDAGNAVGLTGAVRSPKKWNEAVQAAATEGPEPIAVAGAKDAATAVLADGVRIAYARGKPWIYALAGFEDLHVAEQRLAELVALDPAASLAGKPRFADAARQVARDMGLLLWVDRSAFAQLWSRGAGEPDTRGAPQAARGEQGWLADLARPEGLALGLAADAQTLRLEGLLTIEGRLLEALDRTVRGRNLTRVGPAALARSCPAFAMSVLDLGLLVRIAPSVAGSLSRLAGKLGDVLRPSFRGDRGGGALAVGLVGIRPLPDMQPDDTEPDLLEPIDGFLMLQLLGEALTSRVAGRVLDTVGDAVRGGLKRLRVVDQPETRARLGGHEFHVAVRRGALIVATSGEGMRVARQILETPDPEMLPPGFLLGAGVQASRLLDGLQGTIAGEAAAIDEMRAALQRFGKARVELSRVTGGLRISLRQET